LQDLIAKIRNMRANYHIDPTELLEGYAKAEIEKEIIGKLARVRIGTGGVKKKMIQVSTRLRTLRLDIAKSIDVAKETASIRKEIANLENLIAKNEGMLKNKKFTAGAPAEIILSAKNRLEEYKEKVRIQKELEKNLSRL